MHVQIEITEITAVGRRLISAEQISCRITVTESSSLISDTEVASLLLTIMECNV